MKNLNVLDTLFVGIDVSSKSNVLCAMDFHSNILLRFNAPNNQNGTDQLISNLLSLLEGSQFSNVIVALESTSFYGVHIANSLSSDKDLILRNIHVYCLNPKMISNYKKSFIGMGKTDPSDAFVIADFARVGRINIQPWRGSQYLALQRLTRHRLHLVGCITKEKTYMVSNVFLKFSELAVLKNDDHPFSSNHTATAKAVLTEMLSLEDICNLTLEELVSFVCQHSRNRYSNPEAVAKVLQKAARDSYRLDKCLYEPLTISIASSFNCISAYQKEIKIIDNAIEKTVKGLNVSAFKCLQSIPGIGPVFAAGILSEIGTIDSFHSADAIAKYSGIYWNKNQSGDFEAENKRMSKAGNSYLRYYLIEATNSARRFTPELMVHYKKKFDESNTHHHKRALALTSRKLIRLIYGLLAKNQLYSANRVHITS